MNPDSKIILPGGAGLVGQNLVARLKARGCTRLVVLDKHRSNLEVLARMHPDITVECVDLAEDGTWKEHFSGADAVVMLQAQIGGNDWNEFVRNNVDSTRHVLEAIRSHGVQRLVHISSSVLDSAADDFYTRSKKQQEDMVLASGIPALILRPTLMFGWFDRKHLGWLSRFMARVPVFPIPGHGRYMRQPLYAGDFCNVIISGLEHVSQHGVFNITGLEPVDYIDIIRNIKAATGAKAVVIRIPFRIFQAMLWTWSRFDKNPPFTTQQLSALVTPDEFEVIDWPGIFGVQPTSFKAALNETFQHPRYGSVVLDF